MWAFGDGQPGRVGRRLSSAAFNIVSQVLVQPALFLQLVTLSIPCWINAHDWPFPDAPRLRTLCILMQRPRTISPLEEGLFRVAQTLGVRWRVPRLSRLIFDGNSKWCAVVGLPLAAALDPTVTMQDIIVFVQKCLAIPRKRKLRIRFRNLVLDDNLVLDEAVLVELQPEAVAQTFGSC